jgi:hypothetical protein
MPKVSNKTSGRGANVSHLKWYVHGYLGETFIEKKYLSLSSFLDEWGGDNSTLKLNRSKLQRLRKGKPAKPFPGWELVFEPIKEQRMCKHVAVYFD